MKDKRDINDGNIEYEYFRDHEGRVRRVRKPDYKPRPGYVRFKFFEPLYFWWKRKSFDFKLAILPWFLGFFGVYVIYQTSMIGSQIDLEREIKAKLPFEMNAEVYKEMKRRGKLTKENIEKADSVH